MLLQPALDFRSRDHLRYFAAIALIDLLGRRLNVDFSGLFFGGEERLEVLAQRIEQADVVGEFIEHPMDDGLDLPVEGIVMPHRRRPADACARQFVNQHAGRMRLLGEERPIEHRRLQHRDLQTADQRLDAVGQVLGLEDEIEQHGHQLDRHRLELVGLVADRRVANVAQNVVHVLLQPGELHLRTGKIEARFAVLQPPQRIAQLGCHEDAWSAKWSEDRRGGLLPASARYHAARGHGIRAANGTAALRRNVQGVPGRG